MTNVKRYKPGIGKTIGLIGVPLGFGAETRGAELGVSAIKIANFRGNNLVGHIEQLGYEIENYGNLEIAEPDYEPRSEENPRFLAEISESLIGLADVVKATLNKGQMPLIIGGDHSIATGSIAGISSYFRSIGEDFGLLWFDAHADINTPETSPSGNVHGMPLAASLGRGAPQLVQLEGFAPKINPKYFAHIGARDLDLGEKLTVSDFGLREQFFTMSDIDRIGMLECIRRSLEIVSKASGGFGVTFDIDVIDPRFAPGSGTLVRGGITFREAHLALELLAEAGGMRSFEIVEVNPVLDRSNITAKLAGELILSALGNTIL
ncbi:MAG: arginase [Pyrinomonadaceae bacterium]